MSVATYRWRGAVEPADTSPSGNQYKRWRGAIEPEGSGGSIPSGVTAGFSNGSAVTDEGAIRVIEVTIDFAGAVGDVFINGTRHSSLGLMYVADAVAVSGATVLINGIAHHGVSGVRHIQSGNTENKWPEGFSTDLDGRQAYMTDAVSVAGYQSGIGRDLNGAILLNT